MVVTTPEVSAIRDADRIVGLLEANEMKRIDLIVNRLRMDMVKRGDMMKVEDVTDILAVNLIGAVPDDETYRCFYKTRAKPLVGSDCLAGKSICQYQQTYYRRRCSIFRLGSKTGCIWKINGFI